MDCLSSPDDKRMSHLTNKLYRNKHMDCLSSPDVKNAWDNTHKDFVVVLTDKVTGNIALVCKRFYASVITRELGLNNNSSTDTIVSSPWDQGGMIFVSSARQGGNC